MSYSCLPISSTKFCSTAIGTASQNVTNKAFLWLKMPAKNFEGEKKFKLGILCQKLWKRKVTLRCIWRRKRGNCTWRHWWGESATQCSLRRNVPVSWARLINVNFVQCSVSDSHMHNKLQSLINPYRGKAPVCFCSSLHLFDSRYKKKPSTEQQT